MAIEPDINWVVDCEIELLTLSISFDNRLMISPWERPVEKSERQLLQFCKHRLPKPLDYALRKPGHDPALQESKPTIAM